MRMKRYWAGLVALSLLCACDWEWEWETTEQVPQTFELQCANPTLDVFGGTLYVAVVCDLSWSVSLEDAGWGKVTVDKDKGIIAFEADFYDATGSRSNGLIVRAGSATKQLTLLQTGTDHLFTPSQVTLRETEPVRLEFRSTVDWEASVSEKDKWIVLSASQGESGAVKLLVSAADANEQVGERQGTVHFRFGIHTIPLVVVQGQKNVILMDAEGASVSFRGGEIEVLTRSNVDYTYTCSESWITAASTKAPLKEAAECFVVARNDLSESRTATIEFSYGEGADLVRESFTVLQMGKDALLDQTVFGLYGREEWAPCTHEAGLTQISRLKKADGSRAFRLLYPALERVVEVDGLPQQLAPGDAVLVKVAVREKMNTVATQRLSCQVLDVDAESGLAWLKADEDGSGIVVSF